MKIAPTKTKQPRWEVTLATPKDGARKHIVRASDKTTAGKRATRAYKDATAVLVKPLDHQITEETA